MTTLGFYLRGLDNDEANALRARLNDLAASMGYIAHGGPTAGEGNLAALLMAIDAGEVALVLLPDEQRMALVPWLREWAQGVQDIRIADGLITLADALSAAAQREDRAMFGALNELIDRFGPDAEVEYVGEIWGNTRYITTLGQLRADLTDIGYDDAGMAANLHADPGEMVLGDEHGNAVLILK